MSKVATGKPVTINLTDAQIKRAILAGEVADATEPRATAVRYDRDSGRLVIDLCNGVSFLVPVSMLQGLAGASPEDIEAAEIEGDGYGLHWEALDADFTVSGLVNGIFGTQRWMAEIGGRGGRKSSAAKAAAVRENGKKGGRPRKQIAA